jgi:hypothetical protein
VLGSTSPTCIGAYARIHARMCAWECVCAHSCVRAWGLQLPRWRVRPDEATSERRSTVQRKTTTGPPGKRCPTARPE